MGSAVKRWATRPDDNRPCASLKHGALRVGVFVCPVRVRWRRAARVQERIDSCDVGRLMRMRASVRD